MRGFEWTWSILAWGAELLRERWKGLVTVSIEFFGLLGKTPCWTAPHRPASLVVAVRAKKEPVESNRDVIYFGAGGSYIEHPGATPHCVQQTAGRMRRQSAMLREKEAPVYRGMDYR